MENQNKRTKEVKESADNLQALDSKIEKTTSKIMKQFSISFENSKQTHLKIGKSQNDDLYSKIASMGAEQGAKNGQIGTIHQVFV